MGAARDHDAGVESRARARSFHRTRMLIVACCRRSWIGRAFRRNRRRSGRPPPPQVSSTPHGPRFQAHGGVLPARLGWSTARQKGSGAFEEAQERRALLGGERPYVSSVIRRLSMRCGSRAATRTSPEKLAAASAAMMPRRPRLRSVLKRCSRAHPPPPGGDAFTHIGIHCHLRSCPAGPSAAAPTMRLEPWPPENEREVARRRRD